jgi:hypothetical protein
VEIGRKEEGGVWWTDIQNPWMADGEGEGGEDTQQVRDGDSRWIHMGTSMGSRVRGLAKPPHPFDTTRIVHVLPATSKVRFPAPGYDAFGLSVSPLYSCHFAVAVWVPRATARNSARWSDGFIFDRERDVLRKWPEMVEETVTRTSSQNLR